MYKNISKYIYINVKMCKYIEMSVEKHLCGNIKEYLKNIKYKFMHNV